MVFNNNCPVSILYALSKVLEKVIYVYERLLHFVNEFDILYVFQFGFWKDCFTNMTNIILMDELTTEFTVGVFLDFSKVFYLINYIIIIYTELHFHRWKVIYQIYITVCYI